MKCVKFGFELTQINSIIYKLQTQSKLMSLNQLIVCEKYKNSEEIVQLIEDKTINENELNRVLEVLTIYEGLGFAKLLRLPGYLHDSTESLMVNQLVIRQILSD